MAAQDHGWVVPVMRAGYGARAAVYVVLGVIALLAAWSGGEAEGTTGALNQLRVHGWGNAMLAVIGIGLIFYAVWRGMAATYDLDEHGSDMEGVVARAGQVITGAIHLGLGIYALGLAVGGLVGGEGEAPETLTSQLLSMPAGQILVGIVGLIVIGAGGYYAWKGISGDYRKRLKGSEVTRKLSPVCVGGLVAHGAAIALIGVFLLFAAWTSDPSRAGGLGQAFEAVRAATFGQVLLVAMALGMLGFAVYCGVQAIWRLAPRKVRSDTPSLSDWLRDKAEKAAS